MESEAKTAGVRVTIPADMAARLMKAGADQDPPVTRSRYILSVLDASLRETSR